MRLKKLLTGLAPVLVVGAFGVVPVAAQAAAHYEYVFNNGPVSVYDIDNGFKLVESFTLPGTNRGVRGVAVSPVTHMMFVCYGGDGGAHGNGSVLGYDLLNKRIVWSVNLSTGIDSAAVSNDGKRLYVPDGEASSDGNWYILDTAKGTVMGKIETPGPGPHDGVMSADGKLLQLGDRNYTRLPIYNTQTHEVQAQVGPLMGGVRPNTINGADSVSFTTATGFDGFQVGSITQPGAPVLYTESFGSCTGPFTTCSHGISLSPDNKQLYVIDSVHKAVQVWDVYGVAEGIAPAHIADVPVDGIEGQEEGCVYDCGRDGWLQYSLDGRYVFAGDTGDVIETATHRVAAKITNLLNTRMFIEIDWSGGLPIATSGRQGIGLLSPIVVTGAASAGETSATLHGTVNPNGGEVGECVFEYGTTTSYGSSAPCAPAPGSGTGPVAVSATVTGLSANTSYFFRVSATNAGGAGQGADQPFTTPASAAAHYFSGGLSELSRVGVEERVPVISWGTLALTNVTSGSKVECRELVAGVVENPLPGGAEAPPGVGEIQSFSAYGCESAACTPEAMKAGPATYVSLRPETISAPFPESGSAINLRWTSHLLTEGKSIRSESEHISLDVICHLNTGMNGQGEPEFGTVIEEVSEGSQRPSVITKCCRRNAPPETEFDAGSGMLHHPPPKEAEKVRIEGKLKTLGYREEEIVNAKTG